MSWLRLSGSLIWLLVELFRWLERHKMRTELTQDFRKKLEEAHREIAADVQAASHDPVVPVRDPNDRDHDNQGPTQSRNT